MPLRFWQWRASRINLGGRCATGAKHSCCWENPTLQMNAKLHFIDIGVGGVLAHVRVLFCCPAVLLQVLAFMLGWFTLRYVASFFA